MPYLFTKWQNFLGPDFFTRTETPGFFISKVTFNKMGYRHH